MFHFRTSFRCIIAALTIAATAGFVPSMSHGCVVLEARQSAPCGCCADGGATSRSAGADACCHGGETHVCRCGCGDHDPDDSRPGTRTDDELRDRTLDRSEARFGVDPISVTRSVGRGRSSWHGSAGCQYATLCRWLR